MTKSIVRRAVVLARGAGTRMRTAESGAALSPEQQRAAESGHKALMPIGGRPFLDFVLTSLADAGVTEVAVVVAPEHGEMRAAYPSGRGPGHVSLSWVVQREPLGTANAVLAARDWAGDDPFLVLNGDNLYPKAALSALTTLGESGLAGFSKASLVATSNIPAERIAAFALLEAGADDLLIRIVEKPDLATVMSTGADALVSMNLWRFESSIFAACQDVTPSSRGEYELPSAVMLAVARGAMFRVVRALGPVLDLSRRGDVAEVARRLTPDGASA